MQPNQNDPLNFQTRRTMRQPIQNQATPTQPQLSSQPPLENPNEARIKPPKKSRKDLLFCIFGAVALVLGIVCFVIPFVMPQKAANNAKFPTIPSQTATAAAYSQLTGEALSDASLVNAPVFCVQTPNGTDGARPHAGLNQAGVVFEAIAEAGITRFAAIYQNPTSAVIGPIRSLRLYYLQWDTPFDCTIVHAGGADDALAAVRDGGYKDLSENYTYMYRGDYTNYDRLWNNLFTNATYLKQFATDYGYTTSNIKGFTRQTPEEAKKSRVNSQVAEKLEITTKTTKNTSTLTPSVTRIDLEFGSWPTFNLVYQYNADNNTYIRTYANGDNHENYVCGSDNLGEVTPESACTLQTLSPSVVIAMVVEEKKAEDNYHEDITAIGSGTAYIFQNGTAVKGTWTKASAADQIKFTDESGAEIALVPGQTWISAIPTYGSVAY